MKTKVSHLMACLIILISVIDYASAQTSNLQLLPASQIKTSRLAPDVNLAETSFKVDDAARVEFRTVSNRNNIIVSITAPNGQVISPDTVLNFGGNYKAYEVPLNERSGFPTFETGFGFHYDLNFNSLGAGIYSVRYTSSQTITAETVLITKLTTNTELKVKLFTMPPTVNLGQPVSLALALFDGNAPVTGQMST